MFIVTYPELETFAANIGEDETEEEAGDLAPGNEAENVEGDKEKLHTKVSLPPKKTKLKADQLHMQQMPCKCPLIIDTQTDTLDW